GGGDYDDVAWSMTMNNSGDIFVTGEFRAYAEFSPNNDRHLTSKGDADAFVACYDISGNVKWVARGGSKADDRARGIGTDGTTMFITGQIGGKGTDASDFGEWSVTAVDTSDIFISAISSDGIWLWT